MKHNFYLYSFVLLLVAANFLLMYKLSNLEYKFDTLREANVRLSQGKELTSSQIEVRSFKEESYIDQQERDTTLILTVVALLATFTAFFTFRGVKDEFEAFKLSINDKYIKVENKNSEQQKRLANLEVDVSFQLAIIHEDQATKFYMKDKMDYYINSLLCSAEELAFVLNNQTDENEMFLENTYKDVIDTLNKIIREQEGKEKINQTKLVDFDRFRKRIKQIEKCLKKDDYHLITQVDSMFVYLV